jgi:hypothetical protein
MLPIVVLPSPVGLGNLLAPALIAIVLQGPSVELVIVAGLVGLVVLAWFVIGGLAAAMLEAEAAWLVAHGDDGLGVSGPFVAAHRPEAPRRRVATRIVIARAAAHVPTVLALVWGSVRLIDVAYRELTSPFDTATPIVLRVLEGAPDAVVAIIVFWAAGEIVGGLAVRRIAFDGAGVIGALRGAVAAAALRPLAVLAAFAVPLAVFGLVLLPSTIAAGAAWGLVRGALRLRGDPFSTTLAVLLFVTLWVVGLLLIAVVAAWRSAVWSVAYRQLRQPAPRGEDPIGIEPG